MQPRMCFDLVAMLSAQPAYRQLLLTIPTRCCYTPAQFFNPQHVFAACCNSNFIIRCITLKDIVDGSTPTQRHTCFGTNLPRCHDEIRAHSVVVTASIAALLQVLEL